MISGLKGKIESIGLNSVELDVSGVYYQVFVSKRLANKLVIGDEIKLKTYMAVSETDMSLYGFDDIEGVGMFKMLLGVSGVGPKSAVLIFDDNGVEEIRKAVINADVDFFQRVKGLGKKTAQKIIIDLKSKIGSMKDLDLRGEESDLKEDEVYLSLIQLGFDRKSVNEVMKKIPKDFESTQNRLEWCLKSM